MRILAFLAMLFVAYQFGKVSGTRVVIKSDPLPGNFYAEEIHAERFCTDKWGNTILATRIRSGKTTITD